ncbi:MAG: hypothetical protein U0802_17450 [Candidatus Binatia bacterium]
MGARPAAFHQPPPPPPPPPPPELPLPLPLLEPGATAEEAMALERDEPTSEPNRVAPTWSHDWPLYQRGPAPR